MTDLIAEVGSELYQDARVPSNEVQSITLRLEGGDGARPGFANLAGAGRSGRLEQGANQYLRRTLDDSFDQCGPHDAPESIRLGILGERVTANAGRRTVFRNI